MISCSPPISHADIAKRIIAKVATFQSAQADIAREFKLRRIRTLVEQGQVPISTTLSFPIDLNIDMLSISGDITGSGKRVVCTNDTITLISEVSDFLTRNIQNGAYELWFKSTGDAVLSFKSETDKTLFRTAFGII